MLQVLFVLTILSIKEPLVTHIDDNLKEVSCSPFVVRKAENILNYIDNAIYFYKKYNDLEIIKTMGNIPNFNEFIDIKFDFKNKIKNPTEQSIENLEKQAALYRNFINNKNNLC